MMRGKSPPSELILEVIKSNNSLRVFKNNFEREIISMFVKILYCFIFFALILVKRAKLRIISLFISIILKFAIFTH